MDFSAFIMVAALAFCPCALPPSAALIACPTAAFAHPAALCVCPLAALPRTDPAASSHSFSRLHPTSLPSILIMANSPQLDRTIPLHPPDRIPVTWPQRFESCRVNLQRSGIQGKVYLLSGNRMPSPPRHPGDTIRRPDEGPGVKGTVCVFELTNDSEVVRKGTSPWCEAVHTRLIRQVDTDDKGNFDIPLPPGTYSVFTKKGNLFYASRRDQLNNIAPVKVLPGRMTPVDCSVESNQKVVY